MRLLASKARKEGWQKQVAWIKLKCFFLYYRYLHLYLCLQLYYMTCVSCQSNNRKQVTQIQLECVFISFTIYILADLWHDCKAKVKRWNWDDKEGTPFFVFFLFTCFLSFSLFAMTAWQWDCDFWCDFCVELRERLKSIWERIGGGHHFSFYQANTT